MLSVGDPVTVLDCLVIVFLVVKQPVRLISYCLNVSAFFFFFFFLLCLSFVCLFAPSLHVVLLLVHVRLLKLNIICLFIQKYIYIYIYICSKVEDFIEGETIAFCIKEKRPTSRSETRVNWSEERKNMISKLSFIGELSNATLHYMLWKLNN